MSLLCSPLRSPLLGSWKSQVRRNPCRALTFFLLSSLAFSQSNYTWNNVRIVAGGFITGIVYHSNVQNLVYTRTDIGGLYRSTNGGTSWVPLLDWVNWSNWGYSGVAAVAVDPNNANTVYAAVGGYTNGWDPNNGAILKSTDQGNSWSVAALPFKVGGNMPGRGNGERLAVDPNNSNILYFGAAGDPNTTFGYRRRGMALDQRWRKLH